MSGSILAAPFLLENTGNADSGRKPIFREVVSDGSDFILSRSLQAFGWDVRDPVHIFHHETKSECLAGLSDFVWFDFGIARRAVRAQDWKPTHSGLQKHTVSFIWAQCLPPRPLLHHPFPHTRYAHTFTHSRRPAHTHRHTAPASQLASQRAASQPTSQPASQQTSQPAKQPASRLTSQPAG